MNTPTGGLRGLLGAVEAVEDAERPAIAPDGLSQS
jgi:hypothetical protein